MSNIPAKLDTLNALRAANGKKALVGWKNSEAELDQRINDETPATYTPTVVSEPDLAVIANSMKIAVRKSKVPVTIVPATAPELVDEAKRNGVIEHIADKSVQADKPTTIIDAKAASRAVRKAAKKAKKVTTAKKVAPTKVAAAPRDNAFGALLVKLGLDPKKARAKLRNAGFSAPYLDLKAIEKVLTSDGRKKK